MVRSVLAAIALLATGALAIPGCSDSDSPQNNNNDNRNNTSDRCPTGYLLVPGGTFTMGVDAEDLTGLTAVEYSPDMGPAHKVTLTSDFCMSKNEVTVFSRTRPRDTRSGRKTDTCRLCVTELAIPRFPKRKPRSTFCSR